MIIDDRKDVELKRQIIAPDVGNFILVLVTAAIT